MKQPIVRTPTSPPPRSPLNLTFCLLSHFNVYSIRSNIHPSFRLSDLTFTAICLRPITSICLIIETIIVANCMLRTIRRTYNRQRVLTPTQTVKQNNYVLSTRVVLTLTKSALTRALQRGFKNIEAAMILNLDFLFFTVYLTVQHHQNSLNNFAT